MPYTLLSVFSSLPAFAMVLFRISGLVATAPVLGSSIIPLQVRAMFAAALSVMIFSTVPNPVSPHVSLGLLVTMLLGEILLGIAMGLSISTLLSATEVTGRLVGQQAGLSLGEDYNPTLNMETSVTGQVYAIAFTLVFLLIGGHRELMKALLDSYQLLPIGTIQLGDKPAYLLLEMLVASFLLAMRVAGPAMIALLLTQVALAFLSRTMPQLNILTVGFSFKVMVMLAVAGFGLEASREVIEAAMWYGLDAVKEFLESLAAGGDSHHGL